MLIAFDCDGTLEDYENNTRHEVVDLLRWYLANTDWTILVWSGGGQGRAENVRRSLGYEHNNRVLAKSKQCSLKPDIAVDDMEVNLGKVNIYVGPKQEGEPLPLVEEQHA